MLLLHDRSVRGLLFTLLNLPSVILAGDVETITKDVCIIGGGSSGTYTAIRLQQAGKSVALIEKQPQLGGNVNTYVDPATKQTFDNGVVVFDNVPIVTNYFKYLDVALAPLGASAGASLFADFSNGSAVPAADLYAGNTTTALLAYQKQLDKYPYLNNGYNLPNPVPADLLLSWGDFIKKYNLEAFAFTVSVYNQGVGDILSLPTLYMMKYLNPDETKSLLTGDFLTTKNFNNQQLYDNALKKLGSSVFVSSTVTNVCRTENGVEVTMDTPHGKKLIKASKLVIALRPELSALQPFLDLRSDESQLFSQFKTSHYWCGIVNNTGIPDNTGLTNANPNKPYDIPTLPGLYSIGATGIAGLHSVYYNTDENQSDAAVQSEILTIVDRVRRGMGYKAPTAKPEFVYFHNHSPFFLTVSTDAIKDGFYQKLEALQGQSRTYYTGAAWQTEDSVTIWNFTEHVVLPKLL